MKDSLNPITVGEFRNLLITSEIVITAIVLVGFYFIFKKFVKKQKEYDENK